MEDLELTPQCELQVDATTLRSFGEPEWAVGGPALLSVALLALGVRSLLTETLIPAWQPAPKDPGTVHLLAAASGLTLILLSGMMLTGRGRGLAGWGMTLLLLAWILLLQSPGLAEAPGTVVLWLGVAEVGAVACGAALIACAVGPRGGQARHAVAAARLVFGVCAIIFGLSHFAYVDFTAKMVPAWLPMRTALAYATGAAHVAAGVAIATGVLRRLAAALLALMMGFFVVLVHIPAVLASQGSLLELTFLFDACALCGAAWTVAATTPPDRVRTWTGPYRP